MLPGLVGSSLKSVCIPLFDELIREMEMGGKPVEYWHSHEFLETIWKKVQANTKKSSPYGNATIRKYLSDLAMAIREFLIIQQLEKYPACKWDLLAESLREHHLNKDAEKWSRESLSSLSEHQDDSHFHLSQTKLIQYRTALENKSRSVAINRFYESNESMDTFYIIQKLRQYCEAHSNRALKNQVDGDRAFRMREAVLGLACLPPHEDVPLVQTYYHLCLLFEEANEELHMSQFQHFYLPIAAYVSEEDRLNIENYWQNYLIQRINQHRGELRRTYQIQLHELYHHRMTSGSMLDHHFLLAHNLKNMVSLALHLGKIEEAIRIVEDYHILVAPEVREKAYTFNSAHIALYQGDYQKVRNLLLQIQDLDEFYGLDGRSIRIQALLATFREFPDDLNELQRLLDAFRKYLKRLENKQKISPERIRKYSRKLYFWSQFVKACQLKKEERKSLIKRLSEELNEDVAILEKQKLRSLFDSELERY